MSHAAISTSFSILHAADGTVVYVNRFQAPAYWSPSEVNDDIQRYSRKVGAQPRITEMPMHPGLPKGTLAVWGQVALQILEQESLNDLAVGKSIKDGLLVDFIGDFSRSAREGLPVYRISGGPGFIWVASYGETGQGTLRFCAVDASAYSTPRNEKTPPPTASIVRLPSPQQSEIATSEQEAVMLAYADVSAATLQKDQIIRDALFKDLKASATKYTFDYVVITLPPGTIPGINVPVPVSHIRYSDTVFFAFDRYSLEPPAEAAVLDFAKTLMKDKSYRSIIVVGHTDAIGTDEYNNNLSKNRAAAVAIALRTAGIIDKFLGIVPMGRAQPRTTNSTPEGRALNRRVEFFISDVRGAPEKAIQQIKYDPCYRNDNEPNNNTAPDCAGGPTTVPVLPASGEGRPLATLDLSRSALPSNPHRSRDPLPNEILKRPSVKELQP